MRPKIIKSKWHFLWLLCKGSLVVHAYRYNAWKKKEVARLRKQDLNFEAFRVHLSGPFGYGMVATPDEEDELRF
jgi:hypothetical protein